MTALWVPSVIQGTLGCGPGLGVFAGASLRVHTCARAHQAAGAGQGGPVQRTYMLGRWGVGLWGPMLRSGCWSLPHCHPAPQQSLDCQALTTHGTGNPEPRTMRPEPNPNTAGTAQVHSDLGQASLPSPVGLLGTSDSTTLAARQGLKVAHSSQWTSAEQEMQGPEPPAQKAAASPSALSPQHGCSPDM